MMTPEECAEAWKTVVQIYRDNRENGDNRPDTCVQKILKKLGREKTMEVFATISFIKKHDGRIYGKNREFMNSIKVNPESVAVYETGAAWNPVRYSGLDDIHTSHIDNMISSLREEVQKERENVPAVVPKAKSR